MKKTILVSALTALITTALCFLVVSLVFDDYLESEEYGHHAYFRGDHPRECVKKLHCMGPCGKLTWQGDHPMMDDETLAGLKEQRASFDKELLAEEKETIEKLKKDLKALEENMEADGHADLLKEHKADFEALEAIAEKHKESIDVIMCKLHEKSGRPVKEEVDQEMECKKKCEGDPKMAECMKKCGGEAKEKTAECKMKCEAACKKMCASEKVECEKEVEVIIMEKADGEETRVMMFAGDHCNMSRVHFLLMDF